LEDHLAWIEAEGNWNTNAGDNVVDIAAHLWQRQLTALGPRAPVDYGSPEAAVQHGYLLYTGTHYMGLAHDADDPARPAAELLSLPAEPEFEIPASIEGRPLAQEFVTAFHQLHATAAGIAQTGLVGRLADLSEQFDDATAAAAAAVGLAGLANQIRRMSGLYQDLGDVLREARASAEAAASGPARAAGPSRPAKRGRSAEEEEEQQAKRGRPSGPADTADAAMPVDDSEAVTAGAFGGTGPGILADEGLESEDEADAAVPALADPAVADIRSPEFLRAVDDLADELYGDDMLYGEGPPVPLHEVIGYLVEEGWIQDVPKAGDLRGLVADLTGAQVGEVGPAQVDAALRDLAGMLADAARVAQAGPAGPGSLPGAGNKASRPASPQPAAPAPRAGTQAGEQQASGSAAPTRPTSGQRTIRWNLAWPAQRRGPAAEPVRTGPELASRVAGMDVGAFDVAWGKLRGSPLLDAALAQARKLVRHHHYLPLAHQAGPTAGLTRLEQAIRRVAYYLHATGDRDGARYLAEQLTRGILPPDRPAAPVVRFDSAPGSLTSHADARESLPRLRQMTAADAQRREAEHRDLAAGVFGEGSPSREQLTNLRILADVVRAPGAGRRAVTVADLEAAFRRLHGRAADSDVTGRDVQDLVAMTGEATALLAAGQPVTRDQLADVPRQRAAQAAAFEDLPDNAVAVNADGIYMTVPGGIGAIEGMGHPEFFDANGESLGDILVSQVRDTAGEVSLRVINKLSEVPRVSYLVFWYMTAHTGAPRFTVYDIVNPDLMRILDKLGMTQSHASRKQMSGDTQMVARNAAAAAAGEGWILRVPGRGMPGGSAGQDVQATPVPRAEGGSLAGLRGAGAARGAHLEPGALVSRAATAAPAAGGSRPSGIRAGADGLAAGDGRLSEFRVPAMRLLGSLGHRRGGVSARRAIDDLAAVLAEARGRAGERPRGAAWNALVAAGLGLLSGTSSDVAHAGSLPGVDPGDLAIGAEFTVADPVAAREGRGDGEADGTVFVVAQPQARVIPGSAGPDSSLIMFSPGTWFQVVSIEARGGQRTIFLRHPGGGPGADAAAAAAAAFAEPQPEPPASGSSARTAPDGSTQALGWNLPAPTPRPVPGPESSPAHPEPAAQAAEPDAAFDKVWGKRGVARADQLLGRGHGYDDARARRVLQLAAKLAPAAPSDAARLGELAGRLGLHRQDEPTAAGLGRAFALLDLAAGVHQPAWPSWDDVAAVARLAGLARVVLGRPAGSVVSAADLRTVDREAFGVREMPRPMADYIRRQRMAALAAGVLG
ncbi:MAG TPA: hypothetical protein VK586_00585, partial [Streptosporangiaceae bacterium]|nr:hypothetical protein [Streptosporangiaceae bacterium]